MNAEAVPHEVFRASMFDRRVHATPSAKTWQRLWSKVTGICLHQTACEMGERLERYNRINVHFVVTRAGKVLWMHDLTTGLVAANGWNNQTVSIECDGLYAGLEDDPATVQVNEAMRTTWDDPSTPFREQPQKLTEEAAESARQLIRWIVEEVRRSGGACTKLVAHRQASGSRRNDPGQAIWQQVALPLHAELGMDDGGVGFKLPNPAQHGGDGVAIPEAWDPRCKGVRY